MYSSNEENIENTTNHQKIFQSKHSPEECLKESLGAIMEQSNRKIIPSYNFFFAWTISNRDS